jgi:hypothetical protein
MKAKEYAAKYRMALAAGKTKHDACTDMLVEFLKEIVTLSEVRHVKCGEALAAVFRELNGKWLAVCELQPELPKWGFYGAVEHLQPEVWKELVFLMPELKRRASR